MNINRIRNQLRSVLKPSARAVAVAAGLAVGSAQALTTTQTYDLGTSPAATTIQPGVAGLLPWIGKGTLPPGSILRSVSVDAKLETASSDDWALDLNVYIDPSPETPGTAALLQVGGYGTIGTVGLALTYLNGNTGWANGASGPPATVIDTKTETAWAAIGAVDLSTVTLSVGNDYSQASWSGTITVEYDVFVPAAILSFGPGAVVGPLVGNAAAITWTVPYGTNVTALAPTFTLSSGTSDKDNGGPTTYDFTNPVVYTITDGPTVNAYTVTVTTANAVVWNLASGGDWDTTTANWLPLPSGSPTTFTNGNEVIFDNTAGGTIAIAADMSPAKTTVSAESGTYALVGGPIATGSLTKDGGGTLQVLGVASIPPPPTGATPLSHTYDGGTVVNGGRLILGGIVNGISPDVVNPVGSGMVTLNAGTLEFQRVKAANALTVGDGTTLFQNNGWGATWSGPVTLNGTATINTSFGLNFTGDITGPGGFTKTGPEKLTFSGTNSYTGPVSVTAGTLQCNNPGALGGGDLSISSGGAKVNLNFTGTKAIASLTLGGVAQGGGIFGSLTSDAIFKSASFEGAGTLTVGDPATFAFITSFGANIAGSTAVIDPVDANAAAINWIVPAGTDLATLAPEFVLTPGATSSNQTSGATPVPGFDAGPVVYSIVSEDSSVTNVYTVTVTVVTPESTLIWNLAVNGDWNFTAANWVGQTAGLPALFVDGVNVIFDKTAGGTITVPLTVTVSPGDMTVSATSGIYRWAGGAGNIGGTGTLTKSGAGTLKIGQPNTSPTIPMLNTFSGGTIIDGGELWLEPTSNTGLGTGPVTLNTGTLRLYRITAANNLIVNGGKLYTQNGFGNSWNGTVTLNVTLPIEPMHGLTINGAISGPGGLTVQAQPSMVTLTAANSYTGPTSVTSGTLRCNSPDSLGGGDLSISGTGKVNLNYVGTKNIASLTLGGVAKTAPGTYGSVASGADFPDDAYFIGTGTVTVGGSSGFAVWAATNAPGQTPDQDHDNDGVENGIEYFMGQTGSSFTAMPGLDGTNTVTWAMDPAYSGTYEVQTSPDLATWTNVTPRPVPAGGNLSYTLPSGLGKQFVRLLVTPAP